MRLVLGDDHGMFLEALRSALTFLGHEIVAVSQDAEQVVELVSRYQPDVCVLDVAFPASSGLEAAETIRLQEPGVNLLLLTGSATPAVWEAYDSFVVDGIVNKTCDIEVLDTAIRQVEKGERAVEGWTREPSRLHPAHTQLGRLTDRERQVLDFLVQGASTTKIATELGVSANTVRTHVQNVLHKLGVHGRGKAARLAVDSALTLGSLPG